jgi:hypothetical protein
MTLRTISDIFKAVANDIDEVKSYNFGWPSDRTRSTNTEDFQELNEYPRVFFAVPTVPASNQIRKQDTYQVTVFVDDLLGYDNEGDADLTLQIDKWSDLQVIATKFIQRLNALKQTLLPDYIYIPEPPQMTFDSFVSMQRLVTVQVNFNIVVPTNCDTEIQRQVLVFANLLGEATLQAGININVKVSSQMTGSASLEANLQLTKLASAALSASASLSASALVSKLAASSLSGAGTLAATLTVTSGFDADAQAFFNRVTTAGGTLSLTEQNAVNTLVIALKADGIWTKMKAIYPMVGASAAACAQNLVSSSFTGTFTSGWTFASTGVTPNGTSAFMNTFYNPSVNGLLNSAHLSYYARTAPISGRVFLGGNNLNSSSVMIRHYIGEGIAFSSINSSAEGNYTPSNYLGLNLISRIISTETKQFKNNILTNTSTINSIELTNINLYIAARNSTGIPLNFNISECAFASIGDGLTNTDISNFYTDIQVFQTNLSRQV